MTTAHTKITAASVPDVPVTFPSPPGTVTAGDAGNPDEHYVSGRRGSNPRPSAWESELASGRHDENSVVAGTSPHATDAQDDESARDVPVTFPPRSDQRPYQWRGEIPVAPFRTAVLNLRARGLTDADIARQVGWLDRGAGDGRRLRRAVGLERDVRRDRRGVVRRWPHRQRITYDTAMRLCGALGLDPYEAGL